MNLTSAFKDLDYKPSLKVENTGQMSKSLNIPTACLIIYSFNCTSEVGNVIFINPLLLGVLFQIARALRLSCPLNRVLHYKQTGKSVFVYCLEEVWSLPHCRTSQSCPFCTTTGTGLPVVGRDSFLEVMEVALRGVVVVCFLWERVVVKAASGQPTTV